MLILKRKTHEGVTIDVNGVKVHVTLVDLCGGWARIGFTAPPEVKIFRDELLEPATTRPTLPKDADTRKRGA